MTRSTRWSVLLFVLAASSAGAQPARLVKDIHPGSAVDAGLSPGSFVRVGSVAYFSGAAGLWRTDGTMAGTQLVKPTNSFGLADVSGMLFFLTDDGTSGVQLWKSDGTVTGTELVKDLLAGSAGGYTSDLAQQPVAVRDGIYYFGANDGTTGVELWRSDGTAGGTYMVKDINPGPGSAHVRSLTAAGSTLFFAADDGNAGMELWRSDGTAPGTMRVKDIRSGRGGALAFEPPLDPSALRPVVFSGSLYFPAFDATNAIKLWRSDGTDAGTVAVSDAVTFPESLTVAGGSLFFKGCDAPTGCELWKSDGTSSGTALVRDILAGPTSGSPASLVESGGALFFAAQGVLWRSDGSSGGTFALTGTTSPASLTNAAGTLFFKGCDAATGCEPWKSDGDLASTVLVRDIQPGTGSSLFVPYFIPSRPLFGFGQTVLFAADDGTNGLELWRSDGTSTGTTMLSDLRALRPSSPSGGVGSVEIGGIVYFAAGDGAGIELWKSDGTEAGTALVKDLDPGGGSSAPGNLTAFGNSLYFTAGTSALLPRGLWKSDGTEPGTILVRNGSPESNVAAAGPFLYFTAGGALWRSDAGRR